jgi:cytosine/adenosine deaminase-related metal-dependent hydrolase
MLRREPSGRVKKQSFDHTSLMRAKRILLRARVIVPVSRPPIRDGALLVAGARIAALGRWRDLSGERRARVIDLGDVALLPGLVNAHCHLDYTLMAGQFLPPKVFSDWLKLITSTKAGWSYSDYANSWLAGARMLVRTGTTTVADIEAVPELLPELWGQTPLRVLSFLELIGITGRRQPQVILQEAAERIDLLRSPRCRASISPHAPYSTSRELLRLSVQLAQRRRWRLCTHVAESAEEFEMFTRARGEMYSWLERSSRDMSDCGLGSPVQHLERCGALGDNMLAVHANYLGVGDATLLARRKVSVVHCPRSHSYFRHGTFPMRQLARAGVNVCLGTDSLASVFKRRGQTVELNMFEEMRAMAADHPAVSGKQILRMATVNAALALGMGGRVGELTERSHADVIAIPFAGKTAEVHNAVLQHRGQVAGSMIHGQWSIEPPTG